MMLLSAFAPATNRLVARHIEAAELAGTSATNPCSRSRRLDVLKSGLVVHAKIHRRPDIASRNPDTIFSFSVVSPENKQLLLEK